MLVELAPPVLMLYWCPPQYMKCTYMMLRDTLLWGWAELSFGYQRLAFWCAQPRITPVNGKGRRRQIPRHMRTHKLSCMHGYIRLCLILFNNMLHAYVYVCIYIYIHNYTYVCTLIYIYIYIYIHTYTYTHIYTYIHTCMHNIIHIQSHTSTPSVGIALSTSARAPARAQASRTRAHRAPRRSSRTRMWLQPIPPWNGVTFSSRHTGRSLAADRHTDMLNHFIPIPGSFAAVWEIPFTFSGCTLTNM